MTAEVAEAIAWDLASQAAATATQWVDSGFEAPGLGKWEPSKDLYTAIRAGGVMARTYLTYGWRYKGRTIRNVVSEELKQQLLRRDFPRYVWVTEFSLPAENVDHDPCKRKVRTHVVNDATGSRFWESTLLIDAPGVTFLWDFDAARSGEPPQQSAFFSTDSGGYYPKVRGIDDYSICAV